MSTVPIYMTKEQATMLAEHIGDFAENVGDRAPWDELAALLWAGVGRAKQQEELQANVVVETVPLECSDCGNYHTGNELEATGGSCPDSV